MAPSTFALGYGDKEMPIHSQLVVGRSPVCNVVLADAAVSRLHARFMSQDGEVWVEDLQSANGVFVNGARVLKTAKLSAGDAIRVGQQQFRLIEKDPPRRSATTLPEIPAVRVPRFAPCEPTTERGPAVALLFDWQPLRDAMEHRDIDRAAALMRVAFDRVLDEASASGQLPRRVQEELCQHAVGLASVTRDGFWLNLLFHVHMLLAQPLPTPVASLLPQLVCDVRGLDTLALEAYVKVLRREQERMTMVERRLCVALESALIIASR